MTGDAARSRTWSCDACQRLKLDRSRNCDGDQPRRRVLSVRLPCDPPGTLPDVWYQCPWKAVDSGALAMVERYLVVKDEGIPVVASAADMHVNLIALSRIIRVERIHAEEKRQTSTDVKAEAQRKAKEAELLGSGAGSRYPRGSRKAR